MQFLSFWSFFGWNKKALSFNFLGFLGLIIKSFKVLFCCWRTRTFRLAKSSWFLCFCKKFAPFAFFDKMSMIHNTHLSLILKIHWLVITKVPFCMLSSNSSLLSFLIKIFRLFEIAKKLWDLLLDFGYFFYSWRKC